MSVLVPSFPSTNNSHFFPHHHHLKGSHSQSTKYMSLPSTNFENDQVPFGVVNSMKQRLLDKFSESLLLNSTCQTNSKPSIQTKPNTAPLKQTTRLSRSQDNLLNNNNNNHTEQLTSYLQPKQDVIIVDRTLSNEEKSAAHRLSYSELHIDEVPKPGTVSTVKNMFERQIRLSRHDCDKLANASVPPNARTNHQRRESRSPNRSRSISPNDMALRLRRAAALSIPTSLSLPVSTSYPDLVISHTPPTSNHTESTKISKEESIINTHNDQNTSVSTNSNHPNLLIPSSDTADYQPLDFKSRLALFNRTNTIEKSNEQTHNSSNLKKPINHTQSVSLPSKFLTKPIVHHHHTPSERKDLSSDQISQSIVNASKSITFFGGIKLNENSKSPPKELSPPLIPVDETSVDRFRAPDVIGGNVKLNKSSIFSGIRKDARVQFIDNVNTFEYPSFTIIMAEHDNDSDPADGDDDVNDDELEQLARINAEFSSNNQPEKSIEPKGSLHTFRPSHLDQYELGSQHGSIMSDIYSREKYLTLSDNFSNHSIFKNEMTNHVQWSSMSTTTDLLF